MSPMDFPPKSALYRYFTAWRENGAWRRIHHVLYSQTREQAGHVASPSAAVIGHQSVKTRKAAVSGASTPPKG